MDDAFRQEFLDGAQRQVREDLIIGNAWLSPADRIILVVLERMYPAVRRNRVPIQIWKLAERAGVTRRSVSRFFVAMHEHGYMSYIVMRIVDRDLQGNPAPKTQCFVQELEPCQHPENLNTCSTPKRVEHRKKVKERLRCKKCGSENILVRVTAVCRDCGEEVFK